MSDDKNFKGKRFVSRKSNNSGSNNGNNGHRHSNGNRGGSTRAKYIEKALEALSMGDRVAAENFFQHAEHYGRMEASTNRNNRMDNRHNNQTPPQPEAVLSGEPEAAPI